MVDEKIIPEDIDFGDDLVTEMASNYRHREGWHWFVVEETTKRVSSNDHLMLTMNCRVLEDPDNVESKTGPMIRNNLVLPFENKSVEDHTPPNTRGFCTQFVRAVDGPKKFPYMPARDAKDGGRLKYKEEEISEQESASVKVELAKYWMGRIKGWWQDPDTLNGATFLGLVKANGDYTGIDRTRHALPANAELVPPDQIIEKVL